MPMRIKKFTIRNSHRVDTMAGRDKSFDLSDEERKVLLASHERGCHPPPGMIDQRYMLIRDLALYSEWALGLEFDALDDESEPKTLGYSVVGGQGAAGSSRAPTEGARITTLPIEPQPSTSTDTTSSEALAQRWKELAPQLDEVFEWRRETEEHEDELFPSFEALLRDAGNRGCRFTEDHRRMMEATKEVRRRGSDALERRLATQEALGEERAALEEARFHQERSFAKAKEIQARVDTAREKRFAAGGYRP